MANYLKRMNLGVLTSSQTSAVVSFLQSLGMTSAQASNTKNFTLARNAAGQVIATALVEINGATDSAVLDDLIVGNVVQLLVR